MPAAASSAVAGTTLSSPEAQPLAAAAPLEADLKFDLKYFPKNLVQQGRMLDRIVWVVHVQGQCRVVGCIEAVLTYRGLNHPVCSGKGSQQIFHIRIQAHEFMYEHVPKSTRKVC